MRKKGFFLLAFLTAVFLSALAFAGDNSAIERGEKLFKDPTFAGGTKACSSCHGNGWLLKNIEEKKTFRVKGEIDEWSLETAINACIIIANKGHLIDNKSTEMKNLISYIKSFESEEKKLAGKIGSQGKKPGSKK